MLILKYLLFKKHLPKKSDADFSEFTVKKLKEIAALFDLLFQCYAEPGDKDGKLDKENKSKINDIANKLVLSLNAPELNTPIPLHEKLHDFFAALRSAQKISAEECNWIQTIVNLIFAINIPDVAAAVKFLKTKMQGERNLHSSDAKHVKEAVDYSLALTAKEQELHPEKHPFFRHQKNASIGYRDAQYKMGLYFLNHHLIPEAGIPAEYREGDERVQYCRRQAFQYLSAASQQNHTMAKYNLSLMYRDDHTIALLDGKTFSDDNEKEKYHMTMYRDLTLEAANQGLAAALEAIGNDLYYVSLQQEFARRSPVNALLAKRWRAFDLLRQAAEQGRAKAAITLSYMYFHDHLPLNGFLNGVDSDSYSKLQQAYFWWEFAKIQSDDNADYDPELGRLEDRGILIEFYDKLKAEDEKLKYQLQEFSWCKSLALAGNPKAEALLSNFYFNNIGVPETEYGSITDPDERIVFRLRQAFVWCKKAVLNGVQDMQLMLGDYYFQNQIPETEYGPEIKDDAEKRWVFGVKQGYFWYQSAAEHGDVKAQVSIIMLYDLHIRRYEENGLIIDEEYHKLSDENEKSKYRMRKLQLFAAELAKIPNGEVHAFLAILYFKDSGMVCLENQGMLDNTLIAKHSWEKILFHYKKAKELPWREVGNFTMDRNHFLNYIEKLPVHSVIETFRDDLLSMLIRQNYPINVQNDQEKTALDVAAGLHFPCPNGAIDLLHHRTAIEPCLLGFKKKIVNLFLKIKAEYLLELCRDWKAIISPEKYSVYPFLLEEIAKEMIQKTASDWCVKHQIAIQGYFEKVPFFRNHYDVPSQNKLLMDQSESLLKSIVKNEIDRRIKKYNSWIIRLKNNTKKVEQRPLYRDLKPYLQLFLYKQECNAENQEMTKVIWDIILSYLIKMPESINTAKTRKNQDKLYPSHIAWQSICKSRLEISEFLFTKHQSQIKKESEACAIPLQLQKGALSELASQLNMKRLDESQPQSSKESADGMEPVVSTVDGQSKQIKTRKFY